MVTISTIYYAIKFGRDTPILPAPLTEVFFLLIVSPVLRLDLLTTDGY